MHVLDIDLDFFLRDCCPLAKPGERPVLAGHEPWGVQDIQAFLEDRCGLRADCPIPGRVFLTHDQALQFWRERIGEGSLKAPFCVTHIDAHSDLGIGYPGPGAVLDGVLPVETELRGHFETYYERKQLDEANYLLFSLAFRWVERLINVRNLKSRRDFPTIILDDENPCSIRLSSFASRLMEGKNGREPAIPYEEFADWREYWAEGPFDFVTLAISPRYAPKEADALVPLFQRYMKEI